MGDTGTGRDGAAGTPGSALRRTEGAGRGGICVTLTARDVDGMLALATRAKEGGAGLVEYRLDALDPSALDVPRLLKASPLPAVVTFRLPGDGGLCAEVDEEKRVSLLREALRLGAAYVDIELGRESALASDAARAGRTAAGAPRR